MVHDEFPQLHRPAVASREVLRMLRYRQKLIKLRTMAKNSLQAIALQAGLAKGKQLFTRAGQEEFKAPLCLRCSNGSGNTGSNCYNH